MDWPVYLLIGLIMAATTWFIGMKWRYRAKETIISIGLLAVALPVLIIFLMGVAGGLHSPSTTEPITQLTQSLLVKYVELNLLTIVVWDIAGILFGSTLGLFIRRKH